MEEGDRVSHYKIVRRIGRGGMGVVYQALDTRLHREVAIKWLDCRLEEGPEATRRFLTEARAAGSFSHRNIVTIFGMEVHEGTPFIVMEYVRGGTLRDRLKGGPLPLPEALDQASRLADALAEAHRAGIVHRDVKPANVLLTREGEPKLADFGLVKILGDATGQTGILGTLAYMSPEQIRSEPLDGRSDVFSLGIVIYEMLTGVRPFAGASEVSLMHGILRRAPRRLPPEMDDLPREVLQLLGRTLAKRKEDRPASMEELAEQLRRLRDRWDRLPEEASAAGGIKGHVGMIAAVAGGTGLAALAILASLAPALRATAAGSAAFLLGLGAVLGYEGRPSRWLQGRAAAWSLRALVLGIGAGLAAALLLWTGPGPAPEPPTLWVAPFTNGAGPELEPLTESLPRLLESQLSQEELRLVASPEGPLPVDILVRGELRREGEGVEILLDLEDRRDRGSPHLERWILEDWEEDTAPVLPEMAARIRTVLDLPVVDEAGPSRGAATDPAALRAYMDAQAAMARERWPEARTSLRQALQADETFALAHVALASITKGEEERTALARAMEYRFCVPPRDRWEVMAKYAHLKEASQEALNAAEDWVLHCPRNTEAYEWLMGCYMEKGRFEDAVELGRRALDIGDEPDAKLQLALVGATFELGLWDEALQATRELLSLDPQALQGWSSMAEIHLAKGEYESALRYFREALDRRPGVIRLQWRLAWCCFFLGRLEEARREMEIAWAAQTEPTSRGGTLIELAGLHRQVGENARASEKLKEALEICPDCFKAYWISAELALQRGDAAEVRRLRQSLDERSGTPFLYRHLEIVRLLVQACDAEARGEPGEAETCRRRILETTLPSKRAMARLELVRFLRRQGRIQEARIEVNRSLEEAPHCIPALMERFRIAEEDGEAPVLDEVGRRLQEIWSGADEDFPWLLEVERGLG